MGIRNELSLIGLAAPQGFEPRYADPESAVLPLNEGAASLVRTRSRNWLASLDFMMPREAGQMTLSEALADFRTYNLCPEAAFLVKVEFRCDISITNYNHR